MALLLMYLPYTHFLVIPIPTLLVISFWRPDCHSKDDVSRHFIRFFQT